MKTQLLGTKKRPKAAGAEAALSLQQELVAAIHGAFEVAVEIAVREVTKLVGQATGDSYEEMRRENESLKQRLQRAEALLDTEERESSSPTKQLLNATNLTGQPPLIKYSRFTGVKVDAPPAVHSLGRAQQPPDPQQRHEEQRSAGDLKTPHVSDAASEKRDDGCLVACDALTKEVSDEVSRVCVVEVESTNQPCQELAAEDRDSSPLPSLDDETTLEHVTVKREELDDSACCLDSVKVEDFSPECMSVVQTEMLEEWKPEVLDVQSQDSNSSLSCTRLAQDLPSLSSEFPNIFQLAEPAPIPEAPPQVYGVHVQSSRSHTFTNLYACKSCGQTFHLPSLLRRHYSQCQQRLQQCFQQPVDGSKRTRLQLYPPGCSPFRCTECHREFNRMENLKTHLRIHTGEMPYTCSVCSKSFRHSGALTRHFRIHTGEKPYICGHCGKSFRNCGGLKFHQRSHSKQLQ